MKNLLTQQGFKAWQAEATLYKRAYASSDEHRSRFKLGALVCFHLPLTICHGLEFTDQLLEVKLGGKGFDLLLKSVNKFLTCAKRNSRDVVNRFVSVKLCTLAAHLRQRIHHMAADVLKP